MGSLGISGHTGDSLCLKGSLVVKIISTDKKVFFFANWKFPIGCVREKIAIENL